MNQTPPPPTIGAPPVPAPPPFHRKQFMPVKYVVALVFGGVLLLLALVFTLIGNSEVCKTALQQAKANPDVVARIGQPIKRGLIVQGSVRISGPGGHAELAIPISGPNGKGTLYVISDRSMGLWNCKSLELAVEGDPNRIDLLAASGTPPPGKR